MMEMINVSQEELNDQLMVRREKMNDLRENGLIHLENVLNVHIFAKI